MGEPSHLHHGSRIIIKNRNLNPSIPGAFLVHPCFFQLGFAEDCGISFSNEMVRRPDEHAWPDYDGPGTIELLEPCENRRLFDLYWNADEESDDSVLLPTVLSSSGVYDQDNTGELCSRFGLVMEVNP